MNEKFSNLMENDLRAFFLGLYKGVKFCKNHHNNIRSSYDVNAKGNFKKYRENFVMTDAEFKVREFSNTFKSAWIIPPERLKN